MSKPTKKNLTLIFSYLQLNQMAFSRIIIKNAAYSNVVSLQIAITMLLWEVM